MIRNTASFVWRTCSRTHRFRVAFLVLHTLFLPDRFQSAVSAHLVRKTAAALYTCLHGGCFETYSNWRILSLEVWCMFILCCFLVEECCTVQLFYALCASCKSCGIYCIVVVYSMYCTCPSGLDILMCCCFNSYRVFRIELFQQLNAYRWWCCSHKCYCLSMCKIKITSV